MWRALLLAAVYYGLYQLMGLLVGAVFGTSGGVRGEPGSAVDVLIGTALPIVLASMLLLAFALSLGWLKELFGRQPVPGRGWMWVAVGVVLLINVSAFLSIDYAEAGGALVAAWLFTGLFVGFAEELLTRGFVVNLMRKAGHGEIAVALASSGIFAALHIGNVFTSDQGLAVTLQQVVYTFWFGLCMYLALRVTGNLIWPILLHATTDPTLLLHGEDPASNFFGIIPALSTYLITATGVILLIVLIVSERRRAKSDAATGAPLAA
ncbi:CPBP family intramembrane glutamic endopeptidase [Microbacterium sp. CFBP9034]|uniref:CPBP family intramembrane glutamic endopeptidase n=1 Tax=Microbacterium sp. CFBP9034 TaxID=3096540 RepID=UPI002A6A4E2A|nr:CPBP family intramembrane glutamic endopeptidase [Microbacterium sp. CFBP9034]MDY0908510.1 CPBP family intramembrane glutamic endopeptidase [Microbacterium sp. CFBP9034]